MVLYSFILPCQYSNTILCKKHFQYTQKKVLFECRKLQWFIPAICLAWFSVNCGKINYGRSTSQTSISVRGPREKFWCLIGLPVSEILLVLLSASTGLDLSYNRMIIWSFLFNKTIASPRVEYCVNSVYQ